MIWKNFVDNLTSGIPHSDRRFLGLKIALLGYLIAMVGLLLLFGGLGSSRWIAYLGAGVGAVGIITQLVIMLFKLK